MINTQIKLISHRGNIFGPNPDKENKVPYIQEALDLGHDCEIDVWLLQGNIFLGHDGSTEPLDLNFLKENSGKIWVHCKNLNALEYLISLKGINCFFHDSDDYTLTSHGYIWAYPGRELSPRSVCVLPERSGFKLIPPMYGICTDFVDRISKKL